MNKQDKDKAREIANNYGSVTFIGPFSEKKYSESDCVKATLEMAVWKEQQMIEKAVKFIDENVFGMLDDGVPYIQSIHDTSKNEFIEDLKKYMEEN